MSLLSLVQSFCEKEALSVPTSVIGSQVTTVKQLHALLRELLEELPSESQFTWLTLEATFTAVPAEDQGLLTTLAPNGFRDIVAETLYDRTNRRSLIGPLAPEEWQALKATNVAAALYYYRVREGHLYLFPAPDAASLPEIAFEYTSSWVVLSSSGVPQSTTLADSDTFAIPEYILRRGLTWKWKATKGLPSQADENKYYELLNNYIAKDGTKPSINVSQSGQKFSPTILVPTGNWNV